LSTVPEWTQDTSWICLFFFSSLQRVLLEIFLSPRSSVVSLGLKEDWTAQSLSKDGSCSSYGYLGERAQRGWSTLPRSHSLSQGSVAAALRPEPPRPPPLCLHLPSPEDSPPNTQGAATWVPWGTWRGGHAGGSQVLVPPMLPGFRSALDRGHEEPRGHCLSCWHPGPRTGSRPPSCVSVCHLCVRCAGPPASTSGLHLWPPPLAPYFCLPLALA
jgi:hypothetical protein